MNNNNDDGAFILALHHSLNPCHHWPHKTNCRWVEIQREREREREIYLLMWLVFLGRRMFPHRASFSEVLAFWQIIRKDLYDIHANKMCWIDVEVHWKRETGREKTDVRRGRTKGCRRERRRSWPEGKQRAEGEAAGEVFVRRKRWWRRGGAGSSKAAMRDDAWGEINKRGSGCTENTRGA